MQYLNLTELNGNNGFYFGTWSTPGGIFPFANLTAEFAGRFNADKVDDFIVDWGGLYDNTNPQAGPIGFTGLVFGNSTGFPNFVYTNEPCNITGSCEGGVSCHNLLLEDYFDGVRGFAFKGSAPGDRVGAASAGGLDFNADGFSDFITSAPGAKQLYKIDGGNKKFEPSYTRDNLEGTGNIIIDDVCNSRFGESLATLGDFNKDGYDDFLVNAGIDPIVPSNKTNPILGNAYIVKGTSNLPFINNISDLDKNGNLINVIGMPSSTIPIHLTNTMSYVGDINGDGYPDFAIMGGSYKGSDAAPDVYVVYGGSNISSQIYLDKISENTGFVITGLKNFYNVGYSIAGGKDINNDGVDDLAIGNPCGDESCTGQLIVILGNKIGFPTYVDINNFDRESGFVISGVKSSDGFGHSVTMLQDFNGDKISDVVVSNFNGDIEGDRSIDGYILFGKECLNYPANISDLAQGITLLSEYCGCAGNCFDGFFDIGDVNNDGLSDFLNSRSAATTRGICVLGQNTTSADNEIDMCLLQ